jgi:hypothetical protein
VNSSSARGCIGLNRLAELIEQADHVLLGGRLIEFLPFSERVLEKRAPSVATRSYFIALSDLSQ